MKVAIGSDFAGYPLKEAIKAHLISIGYEVDDFGANNPAEMTPYDEPAITIARKVQEGAYKKAVLCCGTGAGVSIVANKFKGVYAVACEGLYTAERAAVINDANIITFGERVIGAGQACEAVSAWLSLHYLENFPEQRHEFLRSAFKRVQALEDENFK
jgi:ribose 5-phosphate isomerase B